MVWERIEQYNLTLPYNQLTGCTLSLNSYIGFTSYMQLNTKMLNGLLSIYCIIWPALLLKKP